MNRRSMSSWSVLFVLASSLALASCTDVGRCELGTVGCKCDGNTCGPGGACRSGMCEACNPGTLDCTCSPPPGAPCASANLGCTNGTCQSCTPGDLDCGCAAGNTCNSPTSACTNGRCVACALGTVGCGCTASYTCNAGLTCLWIEDRCIPDADTFCADACRWNGDGYCDDGGLNSDYSVCPFGADCTDCGPRESPCAGDPSYGVYCPQTPNTPSSCWSNGTDCNGLNYCSGVANACGTDYRYDCGTAGCVANPCPAMFPSYPTYCPGVDVTCTALNPAACCFGAYRDCSTATNCSGSWFTCFTGEKVDCGTGPGTESCILGP